MAYQSQASDIVAGDTNLALDVYVRDLSTGAVERLSVANDGTEGNDHSYDPVISGDGRLVIFTSFATNLVPLDTNTWRDVFVRDRQTSHTQRVSVSSGGVQGNGISVAATISRDGRTVAFGSAATNLVAGDTNGAEDVFVHDLQTGVTERISVGQGGAEANGSSYRPVLSADGRLVFFASAASNLVAGDTNAATDLFVYDRQTGVTERVDVATDGGEANEGIPNPSFIRAAISGDGRYAVFFSNASNLVPSDADGSVVDVFVRDRVSGVTERVSIPSEGTEPVNGVDPTAPIGISDDGRYVVFTAVEPMTADDTNLYYDEYVVDRRTGQAEMISVTNDGTSSTANSQGGVMDATGRYPTLATFSLNLDNLPPPPTFPFQFYMSVFQRDRGPEVGVVRVTPSVLDCDASVQGMARYGGAVIAEASDPSDDGGATANELGAELTGASLIDRPEVGDLFARLRLASIPTVAAPGVLYTLAFKVDGVGYEVRGARLEPGTSTDPQFVLLRCDAGGCSQIAVLKGGVGTSGNEVRFSIPRIAVGASDASAVTDVQAATGLGDLNTGLVSAIDQMPIPSSSIPQLQVMIGVVPAGTPESQVQYTVEASTSAAAYYAPLGTLEPGTWDIWARACLGNRCGAASAPATCEGISGVQDGGRLQLLTLRRPLPNPFRSTTRLSYALPASGLVSIRILDLQGRRVANLIQAWQPAGEHEVEWNASTRPAGIYLAVVSSGGVTRQQKLIRLP